jgi:hypothetical protein
MNNEIYDDSIENYNQTIITGLEMVAAILTVAGLYLLTIGVALGFILGALGCVAWLIVALSNKLYYLAALNVALFIINVSGAI